MSGAGAAVYVSAVALSGAQKILDRHIPRIDTGRCLACGVLPEPCPPRAYALALFYRAPSLPRRVKGASRPELAGARRVK